MKKKRSSHSKSLFPINARRVYNAEGKRVWLIEGREYLSKRAYHTRVLFSPPVPPPAAEPAKDTTA